MTGSGDRARPRRRWGVRSRIVVTTGALTLVGMAALVVLVWLVLERTVDANVQRLLSDRADAVATNVRVSGATVVVDPSAPRLGDEVAWVFDAAGRQVLGPQGSDVDRAAVEAAHVTGPTVRELDDWALLTRPVAGTGAVVVVGSPLAPYESTRDTAVAVSAALGALVVAAVTGVTAYSVTRALRPVGSMARSAAAWSEHDLGRRFDLGPPHDEVTELGHVLDGLLARVSHAIVAEQRLTAELAHELRTPLTVVRAEAELAAQDPQHSAEVRRRFGRIVAATDRLASVIDTLLAVARQQVASDGSASVDAVLAAAGAHAAPARGGPTITAEPAPGLVVAAPQDVVLRALAPVVDNAVRYATARVVLRARPDGDLVVIEVEDDGPGVPGPDADAVFAPGARAPDSPGAGLGLPLARRVARAAGGDVRLLPGRPTRVVLTLPAG